MKPDWKDAPEWARYVAMDASGEWWLYEECPSQGSDRWIVTDGDYLKTDSRSPTWSQTREKRPC